MKIVGKTVFDTGGASDIIYEDENTPRRLVGVLSEKAKPEDVSINEQVISYLLDSGFIKEDDLSAVDLNRLDRNTQRDDCGGKDDGRASAVVRAF